MDSHSAIADPAAAPRLYSVGHSDHGSAAFIALLRRFNIEVVADVRSQPYSQWVPQFNRESFVRDLQTAGIRYAFMGDILGGRPADRAFYDKDESPNYARLAQSQDFQSGIESLLETGRRARVAFVCSEGDYHNCHRQKLITPALLRRGAQVVHILPDGTQVEAQLEFEQQSLF